MTFGRRVAVGAIHLFYAALFHVFLLLTAPYFLLRALRDARVRTSLAARFGASPDRRGLPRCLWVHGVSVGEVKTARPLIDQLRARRPDLPIVVSSTTPAGVDIARQLFGDASVFQFPLDLSYAMRRSMSRVQPCAIVLMELEVWPNLLRLAAERSIPVMVVNGRISQRSFRGYRRLSGLLSILPGFNSISLYAVQNEAYAERLRALAVPADRVRVTGNLKYDSLPEVRAASALDAHRREVAATGPVIVAGSTHAGEEEFVLRACAELEGVTLVLAPRHVERAADVLRVVERHGRRPRVLTQIRGGDPSGDPRVLLVDTIGELEQFYGLADVVFVGGSLVPVGGHNILEPAALGKPVVFGPHMQNFLEEERLLLEAEAAIRVESGDNLGRVLRGLLADRARAEQLGRRARDAVRAVRGTTQATLDGILRHLSTDARHDR